MKFIKKIKPTHVFMSSVMIVNAGNYFYNLILGRFLGPKQFADAAILITFLLVLSFIAMTFQLVTAKYSIITNHKNKDWFKKTIYNYSLITGVAIGIIIIVVSSFLKDFFNTSSSKMFIVFGLCIPFYFLMSVNRGFYQGLDKLYKLSITYQLEMLSRLILTCSFLYFLSIPPIISVAIGITLSVIFGLIPFDRNGLIKKQEQIINPEFKKNIIHFFAITLFYELSQIMINNSDIILVKHFFNNLDAGLYASLALIGRVVYFIAWMFVMLLLPNVVRLKKEGQNTKPILLKYLVYISIITTTITITCYYFPNAIVQLLFGPEYLSISYLLWKYSVATSLFALANIFSYYYLSLNYYLPVIITGIIGILQIVLIMLYHDSLHEVVIVQIIAMALLLCIQIIFFIASNKQLH